MFSEAKSKTRRLIAIEVRIIAKEEQAFQYVGCANLGPRKLRAQCPLRFRFRISRHGIVSAPTRRAHS